MNSENVPFSRPPFLFVGANAAWVYALAESLAGCNERVKAVATYDSGNFRRLRPQWPARSLPANLEREYWVLPQGYVGALTFLFAPLLAARLRRAQSTFTAPGGSRAPAWVIAPYPWFAKALRGVPDSRLIYYNLDDYPLYQPKRSATILRQEAELVRRAALTLCLAQRQVETLRERFPERAHSIRHFPLGVVEGLLNPAPDHAPAVRTVGYIGNLIDRVDWGLVAKVARLMPDVQFQFIGGIESSRQSTKTPAWEQARKTALALPNVQHMGPVAQDEVGRHYWSSTVNWMPYVTDHAFNRAACPTKIMDGLASGRPFVSTDIPECRLYPEWISIVASAEEAAGQIRQLLDGVRSTESLVKCCRQIEFVRRQHTWRQRAQLLQGWLAV